MVLTLGRMATAVVLIGVLSACTPVRATVTGTKAAAKVATAPVRAVF